MWKQPIFDRTELDVIEAKKLLTDSDYFFKNVSDHKGLCTKETLNRIANNIYHLEHYLKTGNENKPEVEYFKDFQIVTMNDITPMILKLLDMPWELKASHLIKGMYGLHEWQAMNLTEKLIDDLYRITIRQDKENRIYCNDDIYSGEDMI